MKITNRQRNKMRRYRAMGLSHVEISRLIGCSKFTVACELNPDYKDRCRELSRQWRESR